MTNLRNIDFRVIGQRCPVALAVTTKGDDKSVNVFFGPDSDVTCLKSQGDADTLVKLLAMMFCDESADTSRDHVVWVVFLDEFIAPRIVIKDAEGEGDAVDFDAFTKAVESANDRQLAGKDYGETGTLLMQAAAMMVDRASIVLAEEGLSYLNEMLTFGLSPEIVERGKSDAASGAIGSAALKMAAAGSEAETELPGCTAALTSSGELAFWPQDMETEGFEQEARRALSEFGLGGDQAVCLYAGNDGYYQILRVRGEDVSAKDAAVLACVSAGWGDMSNSRRERLLKELR